MPNDRCRTVDEDSPGRVAFVNVTSISFGLLIVIFTILLLHWMRKLKPQITGFQLQRMCSSCGLITSRLKARCLECGAVSASKR
jgi:hypothetical protein